MANIGQRLPQPEEGWLRLGLSNNVIQKVTGTVNTSHSTAYEGKIYEFVLKPSDEMETPPKKAFVQFEGVFTSLRLLGWISNWFSNNVLCKIDDTEYRFNSGTSGSDVLTGLIFNIEGLDLVRHKVLIYSDDKTNDAVKNPGYKAFNLECIDINKGGVILPELSKDYEFPVKTIEKTDVAAYSASCINSEEQLLIAIEDGSMYLTKGDGTYIECGARDANTGYKSTLLFEGYASSLNKYPLLVQNIDSFDMISVTAHIKNGNQMYYTNSVFISKEDLVKFHTLHTESSFIIDGSSSDRVGFTFTDDFSTLKIGYVTTSYNSMGISTIRGYKFTFSNEMALEKRIEELEKKIELLMK